MKKRGLSQVIAVVFLILIVIVISSIVFVWFRGMVQESIIKFDKNIELVCPEVQFDVSYDSLENKLVILNLGNVPIYNLRVKIYTDGGYTIKNINDIYNDLPDVWSGLNMGESFSITSGEFDDSKKIFLIPVLLGNLDTKTKSYICKNEEYQIE